MDIENSGVSSQPPESVPSAAFHDDQRATANEGRYTVAADDLVKSGLTQKDPGVVAQILAEHAAGTPTTTIGERLDVITRR